MPILNVNTDASKQFTKKLGMMHKSAFPNAVRSALNSAAFDVKQDTMPKAAKRSFENRQPNFWKANSRVEMAKGFSVKDMQSVVGFISSSLKGGNNYAVKELEQQEVGGVIKKKSFIPINSARSGGNKSKNVRPINRLSAINNITSSHNAKGKNSKVQFVKSVVHAGAGGTVLSDFKGKKMLWRVNSLERTDGWKWKFKLTPLYSFRKGRSIRVSGHHFMKTASEISAQKIELFYKNAAIKTFNKIPR